MSIKFLLTLIIVLGVFYFLSPITSYADTSCQPIYGGGQTCITTNNIVLDKKVQNPKTSEMVDNLSINDPKYQPESIVTFQISVTNSSNKTITNIDVKDIFPQYVDFSSGTGNFDTNNKTLSFRIDDLKSNETKVFAIKGKVVNTDQISINQGAVVCVVNQANATSDNNNFSQDNSQFCIEKEPVVKGGFPVLSAVSVTETPSTGPGSFQLLGFAVAGVVGYLLRKKS